MFDQIAPFRAKAAMFFVVILLWSANAAAAEQILTIEAATGTFNFRVEVMKSPEERARGLMFRRHLDADAGMLFDFGNESIARMWMKNTYIPLDMLFIRENGVITNIEANTIPHNEEVLSSVGRVRFVLEVNSGTAATLGIRPGDRVILPKSID